MVAMPKQSRAKEGRNVVVPLRVVDISYRAGEIGVQGKVVAKMPIR